MTKTDIAIYRGLKEKFDPEVHVGFFITSDTGELLIGDQSLGQAIIGWEINDGVLKLKLNTGKDILVTFPEATETVKGLLSATDKAQLNALQANLDSKVDKVTGKSLLADSEIEKLAGLPNSTELTNSIATAKAAGDNAQSDLNAHKQNKSNPHEVTKAQVGLGNVTNDAQVKRSEMGVAGGVATLDADGKVPATQLPSYVDDIIDVYATYSKSDTGVLSNVTLYLDAAHTKLVTGEAGKIYQNVADGEPQYQFRWTGTIFSQTGASSLILGEVTGTVYDGAKGKANADNIAKIKGTSLSHIKDAAPITTAADKVSLNYECFEGNQYGAAGTAHTADIPAATTAKAGVMSAADKTKLENLNSKLVVADEEDVTAVDGKIKFKDRGTTNGMGYKILRLPENGILTQDMINQANTIYEIRYNFDLNGATITIPENCTLKFRGGKFKGNGTLGGSSVLVDADEYTVFDDAITHTCPLKNHVVPAVWYGKFGTNYDCAPVINKALTALYNNPYTSYTLVLPNYNIAIESTISVTGRNVNIDGRHNDIIGEVNYIYVKKENLTCFSINAGGCTIRNIFLKNTEVSKNNYIGFHVTGWQTGTLENCNVLSANVGILMEPSNNYIALTHLKDISIRYSNIGIQMEKSSNWMNGVLIEPKWIIECKEYGIKINTGTITTIRGGTCEIGQNYSETASNAIGLEVGGDAQVTIQDCVWGENFTPYFAKVKDTARLNVVGDIYNNSGIQVLDDATCITERPSVLNPDIYSDPQIETKPIVIYSNKHIVNPGNQYFSRLFNLANKEIVNRMDLRVIQPDLNKFGTIQTYNIAEGSSAQSTLSQFSFVCSINIEKEHGNRINIHGSTHRLCISLNKKNQSKRRLLSVEIYKQGESDPVFYKNVIFADLGDFYDDLTKMFNFGCTVNGTTLKLYAGNTVNVVELPLSVAVDPEIVTAEYLYRFDTFKLWNVVLTTKQLRLELDRVNDVEPLSYGPSDARPITVPIGFKYFDTDLNRTIIKTGLDRTTENGYFQYAKWTDPVAESVSWKIIR